MPGFQSTIIKRSFPGCSFIIRTSINNIIAYILSILLCNIIAVYIRSKFKLK